MNDDRWTCNSCNAKVPDYRLTCFCGEHRT